MTGRRRDKGKHIGASNKARRSRVAFEQRIDRVDTPTEKVALGWDYFRSAARRARRANPELAAAVEERALHALTAMAEELDEAAVAAALQWKEGSH
jgi:hypothetical protein